ncbi:ricin-type beta-trefoil lectin domain protein [Actinacidiphila acididurans]|uniref:galactosylceramidase n=1 Tax=Actinacidiphila acididurans TaxID=2784346 RepID=A0ABS2THZ8_9ACTN|nr:ricin-type beta-trefoil lectin domain protein [Actinacidiphila acididurans]MBM9502974.1 ricin-type beta-trefoil lectin domain protein [Actinacidiphila acididurans]
MQRLVRPLLPLWLLALVAAVLTVATSPAHAATTTTVTVDGSQGGRTFDGIGAISGGGGNSRLLRDYPAAQQAQILDYLFKPGYGANLQLLKLEIGGDANSTDGSEPSIEHTRGTINCDAGYEFWLGEQAKARNPDIKLYGLAWAAPGWINGGFWSTDTINYLISWLGCAKQHGLTISYLGGWNERGHDVDWYIQLRSALNNAGYGSVQIVGDDSGWSVADDMASNSAFNNAVSIIGAHYPCEGGDGGNADTCSSTTTARNNGKPLWASENGSLDMDAGAPALIRSIVRGYVDARMTAYLNWPLVAAIYPNLPYSTVGLATANSPWSGHYSIGEDTWATAQVTQFAQPGWQFIDSASGYLGGLESNGTYATLKSPNGTDYSTVLETTTATAAQTVDVHVQGGLSTGAVHVWATRVNSPSAAADFVHTQDITPQGGSYSLTLQPGWIYTVSTTTGQGKGTATAPAAHGLALPYTDSFDNDSSGTEATYLSDMQGSFEARPCADGRSGQCVQQVTPVKPIEWQDDSDAFSLVGDPVWSDYTVKADVDLQQAGAVELLGRAGTQNRPQSHQAAYELRIADSGAWSIVRTSAAGGSTILASGAHAALGTRAWHTLGLGFSGDLITATVDGATLGTATDSTYSAGQVGIGVVGYRTDLFDNLSVTANPPGDHGGILKGGASGLCADVPGASQTNGTQLALWDCNGAANQSWTLTSAGRLTVYGGAKCLDVNGGATADGTAVQIWDCNSTAAQQWTVGADGAVVNTGSGKCLDATGNGTAPGTLLEIWTCSGGANQTWFRGGTTGPVKGRESGRCVDVPGLSQTDGTRPALWDCNGGSNQTWTSTTTNQLTVYDTKCLDVTGGATADGSPVEIYGCNGTAAQQWRVRSDGAVVNVGSGKCLDATAHGTANSTLLEIWTCNGGANQIWQRS